MKKSQKERKKSPSFKSSWIGNVPDTQERYLGFQFCLRFAVCRMGPWIHLQNVAGTFQHGPLWGARPLSWKKQLNCTWQF